MIEVRNLTIKAGDFHMERLNLLLKEGNFHVLLGPTGSGKTLILESIIGLRKFQDGKILVGGQEIQAWPPEKRGISYVPQDLALFPHLSVRQNLLYGLRRGWMDSAPNHSLVDSMIDVLKIRHLLDRFPERLSGGEKQRVALGRALAPSPRLLLLDEPLTALDPGLRAEIQQLLVSLHRSLRFTALHVTHDLDEAYLLGDFITVLIDGKVEQVGTREDVFLHPQTLNVARFLGLRNLFPQKVRQVQEGATTIGFLGKEIQIPADHGARSFVPGENVVLYIRPEEVMILREGKPIKESLRRQIFPGKILEILDRGTHRWVLFQSAVMDAQIEISLPNYVFRNLGLAEGKEIRVAMRQESFWAIPDGRKL